MKEDLFAELRSMLRDLEGLVDEIVDHPKAETLYEIVEKLHVWKCRATSHQWYYDQCGYWQHQYCGECGSRKYPDLNKKSCHELTAEMGKMTEEEFLLKQKTK